MTKFQEKGKSGQWVWVSLLPRCTVSLSPNPRPESGACLVLRGAPGASLPLHLRGVLACVSEEADAHSTC